MATALERVREEERAAVEKERAMGEAARERQMATALEKVRENGKRRWRKRGRWERRPERGKWRQG